MPKPEPSLQTTITLREAQCIVTSLGFLLDQQEGVMSGELLTRFEAVKVQYQLIIKELKGGEKEL